MSSEHVTTISKREERKGHTVHGCKGRKTKKTIVRQKKLTSKRRELESGPSNTDEKDKEGNEGGNIDAWQRFLLLLRLRPRRRSRRFGRSRFSSYQTSRDRPLTARRTGRRQVLVRPRIRVRASTDTNRP